MLLQSQEHYSKHLNGLIMVGVLPWMEAPYFNLMVYARPYSLCQATIGVGFIETGETWTNSLSLSGGGDVQSFSLFVADLSNKEINSPNTSFERTNFTVSTNGKYADKLTLNAKVMYSHEYAKNRPSAV